MSTASLAQPCVNATARSESLTVDYYLDGDTLIVASATIPGRLYIVTATACSCPVGVQELPCRHAAYRLAILHPRRTLLSNDAADVVCA